MSESSQPSLLWNWRIWLGLGVTTLAFYWTLRDVDLASVREAIARANLWLVVATTPIAVLGIWMRSVRWQVLTLGLAERPLPIGALFRSTAVGFLAINVFPLRVGEIIRPWFLAQETGVRGSAALGTLILERAIDFSSVATLGALVLLVHGSSIPTWVTTAALTLAALSMIPYVLAFAMRKNETATLSLLSQLARPLPERLQARVLDSLNEVCRGLASLRGIGPTLRVIAYSALCWGGVFAAPYAIGVVAFGIELPPAEIVMAGYTVTVFTALASAAPAAPGFFGVFHFACREALALFGVDPALGVAFGTVAHLAYWLPVTLLGMAAAFSSGTPLATLASPSFSRSLGKAPSEPHR